MELRYFLRSHSGSMFNAGFSRIRSGASSFLWVVQGDDTNG
jgi:hypothetical protein